MRLRQHGWTIIELDDGASRGAEVVRQASEAAERFFLQATQEQKEAARLLFSEGPCSTGKGLVGYNNPTPAKEVYRLRRGSAQPWPAFEDDTFRVLVEESFTLLESLVYSAMRWVGEDLASSADESPDHLLERYCHRPSHDRSDQPPESSTTDGDGTTTGADRGHSAPLRFDTSPFDLFYYKNTEASRHVVNCHRHVDPGFMTVVPCAATPGLELLDAATMEWISVERTGRPHKDVALFCGQSLQTVSEGVYPGIVHCVGRSRRPRLSLVYELRPAVHD